MRQIASRVYAALLLVAGIQMGAYLIRAVFQSTGAISETPAGYANDASRLNLTPVRQVWEIPEDPLTAEKQLAELLAMARRERIPVSIAGARHSMGGQTLVADGIVVDMSRSAGMDFNSDRNLLRAQAGARWESILPYLDARGKSVAVMQSDNSFSVGGSVSVNCHGWQFDRPPIASTVESFRLMKSDGSIVQCSREENAQLFSLVLGGYGLFGVILDLELRVVNNARYRPEQHLVPASDAMQNFRDYIQDRHGTEMAYARLKIVPEDLFGEVMVTAFSREDGDIPDLGGAEYAGLQRLIFRGSAGNDYGKQVRWTTETKIHPLLSSAAVSRNTLLNQSAIVLQNRRPSSTDILHEYFVPNESVPEFVTRMRQIIPESGCDLLNVTVRCVNEDHDSFLRYADKNMVSFVLLFNQPLGSEPEQRSKSLTRCLIDAALACGGRYYLPYRMHATPEQFQRAYPQSGTFFALKRHYDPDELFQNAFYRQYGRRAPNQP